MWFYAYDPQGLDPEPVHPAIIPQAPGVKPNPVRDNGRNTLSGNSPRRLAKSTRARLDAEYSSYTAAKNIAGIR